MLENVPQGKRHPSGTVEEEAPGCHVERAARDGRCAQAEASGQGHIGTSGRDGGHCVWTGRRTSSGEPRLLAPEFGPCLGA